MDSWLRHNLYFSCSANVVDNYSRSKTSRKYELEFPIVKIILSQPNPIVHNSLSLCLYFGVIDMGRYKLRMGIRDCERFALDDLGMDSHAYYLYCTRRAY